MNKLQGFNAKYSEVLSVLKHSIDVILTLIRTILVSAGIPFALIFILLVEQDRLYHGIKIFGEDDGLSHLAAWVLVILNMILEFLIVYEEDMKGFEHKQDRKWSIKFFWSDLRYLLWADKEQMKSPAKRYIGTLKTVTFTILFLALLGSMDEQIKAQEGAWHQSLIKIFSDSKLEDFMEWVGGLLFAFTLVTAAQSLARYVAVHTTNIIRHLQLDAEEVASYAAHQEEIKKQQEEEKKVSVRVHEGPVRFLPPNTWVAVCPVCQWTKPYDNQDSAMSGLRSHKPHCKQQSPNGHVKPEEALEAN